MTPSLPTLSIASAMILPIVSSLFAEMVPTCATMLPLTGFDIFFSLGGDHLDGLLDAALDVHRVRAGDDVLRAFTVDGLRQHGRGGRAIARDVRRLARDLAHHLRAHVLERILQIDLLRDRDAVLRDRGRSELLVEDDVAPFRSERHFHRVGELIDTAQDRLARVLAVTICFAIDPRLLLLSLASPPLASLPPSMTARTSSSRMMRNSSPSSLISCPEYAAEQDCVAGFHVERDALAVVFRLAVADSDDLALLRLFLGGVGDDDSADFLLAFLDALNDDAVVQRSDVHALCSVL